MSIGVYITSAYLSIGNQTNSVTFWLVKEQYLDKQTMGNTTAVKDEFVRCFLIPVVLI